MEASQINEKRFGGKFPNSTKIEAGDHIEVTKFSPFKTEDGLDGVSLTDRNGKLYHTTTVQPVGYILSKKLDLQSLINNSGDGAVSLYFASDTPKDSPRSSMLKCSIYRPRG